MAVLLEPPVATIDADPEAFYRELVSRNRGLIPAATQDLLRHARLLVAGCGSTGGAIIEPLVRTGAEELLLADNGDFELNNLNRQAARLRDLGMNKAEVARGRMLEINPYARIQAETQGLTPGNIREFVEWSQIVIDAVDVTAREPLLIKYQLHQWAKKLGRPVISGYDIAGSQLLIVYDYRRPGEKVLGGRVTEAEIRRIVPLAFLVKLISPRYVPAEMVQELGRLAADPGRPSPQLAVAALLFGSLATQATLSLLAGLPVRREIYVDTAACTRPWLHNVAISLVKWWQLAKLKRQASRRLEQAGGA